MFEVKGTGEISHVTRSTAFMVGPTLLFVLLSLKLVAASPFVTTWNITEAHEFIELPPLRVQSNLSIDFGDSNITSFFPSGTIVISHPYVSPGLYNVSMEGEFFWGAAAPSTTQTKLVDIVSWGDGFLVDADSANLFTFYSNLQVSAPPNTQPVFLPGASLSSMFSSTSFNSSLDWDLANVTDLTIMLALTPLNQPITFRNTQNVTSIQGMFHGATEFNQPFHFDDASSLLDASGLFEYAYAFNQVVNLTNSPKLTSTSNMFLEASSFNQPVLINTDSVQFMDGMFAQAVKFNQPVNFNTSLVDDMGGMFSGATDFNQPINFNTPELTSVAYMFENALSFNQPVVMNTSSVTNMAGMFSNASSFASTVTFTSTASVTNMNNMFDGADQFTQDLSSWDTTNVASCSQFCSWCGLSSFPACSPCSPRLTNERNMSVCSTRVPTMAPSAAPSTSAPSAAPSTAPSTVAPSSSAPSTAPSTSAPSRGSSVSAAAVAVPSFMSAVLIVLGFAP